MVYDTEAIHSAYLQVNVYFISLSKYERGGGDGLNDD